MSPRIIVLDSDERRARAQSAVSNLPCDSSMEVVIRLRTKQRKPDQNALMWAGPLRDIAAQGFVEGRRYSAEVWHEHYKILYLPEEFDAELCKEGYRKWEYTPSGARVLVGSTTQLTINGFAQYLTQVEADGAGMGVMFTERREEVGAAR